jgi:hypothetical protein
VVELLEEHQEQHLLHQERTQQLHQLPQLKAQQLPQVQRWLQHLPQLQVRKYFSNIFSYMYIASEWVIVV